MQLSSEELPHNKKVTLVELETNRHFGEELNYREIKSSWKFNEKTYRCIVLGSTCLQINVGTEHSSEVC